MKPVSAREDGSVTFEFDNLCQHTSIVGVDEPIRVLIPKDRLLQFQKNSAEAGVAGRLVAQNFKNLMARKG